ncbi:hypothetical protein D915_004624 [Fasciola hepatica]|uniref:ABC transporter domain-containing protein n=1 Tax=Fasciola hepatica TaxID=6192 RepID=A0A4E0RBK2_FASHE|nr:hypothetical protein D915_004624 [Fasciola hepatica]
MGLSHTDSSRQPNGFGSYSATQPIWSSTVIPKPYVRKQWRLCKYARIYRILLWKNWLVRRRSPVLLIAELLFPLLFVLILAAFRLHTPVYKEPACHVQSQSMPSMGLLHYVQSMLCNFNYTCHDTDPVPLTLLQPESPLFFLVRNITALIEDEDVRNLLTTFDGSISFEHIPTLIHLQSLISSLWTSYETISRRFVIPHPKNSMQRYTHTARELSSLFCGQRNPKENDLGRLVYLVESFDAFNLSDFLEHMEPTTPSTSENETLEHTVYPGRARAHRLNACGLLEYVLTFNPAQNAAGRIRQFLFGQVAYYPHTPLTEKIIDEAGARYQLLTKLHQLTKLYFNVTRPWVNQFFTNSSRLQAFREQMQSCAEDTLFLPTSVVHACSLIRQWSDPMTGAADSADKNRTQIHWTRTMESTDFVIGLVESVLDCMPFKDRFIPFSNKTLFDDFLITNQLDLLRSPIGVIFENMPSFWNNHTGRAEPYDTNQSELISLVFRKSPFMIDTTYRYKVLDYYRNPIPRRHPSTDMKYFTSGFIDLQEDLSRAILKLIGTSDQGSPTSSATSSGTEFKLFPSAPFINDGFMDFFAPNLPQLMVLAWSLTVVSAVKYMVDEKEHGLTEMLTLLGVPSVLVQASWFTVSVVLIISSCVPILAILKLTGIVANSNPVLLFCFTMSYAIAILSFAVMCSCLFHRANLAAVVSGCVYFLFFLPAPLLLRYENFLSPEVLLGASLLPQVSHGFGWAYFIRLEVHGTGAQWDSLWYADQADAPYSLGLAFVFLWLSVLLHLIMAVFVIPWLRLVYRWSLPGLTRILYGPSGQATYQGWMSALREHRLTEFLRQRRTGNAVGVGDGVTSPDVNGADPIDSLPETPLAARSTNPTVVIQNLGKTYRYPHFTALENVSLTMYPDEITVILGHNGAGKTTLLSILTGTTQPTSGVVLINGYNTRTQMDEVREQMGYCPQRDILYSDLTVAEHIRFYSALRGFTGRLLHTKVDAYLDEFNFQTKRDALAKTLSGGQKRKLSVCLAFVGDASVVLLDEPTAGVDPLSKRVIWDTIRAMRPGRTVLFTSHHMREAEFLSDHIAILSRGRVCCASSSVSLKAKYGVGYLITLDRGSMKDPISWSELTSVVRKFIPKATRISETGNCMKMRIPLEAALDGDDLIQLFRHLEFQSYGVRVSVTDTSLEDIFIEIMTLTVPNWANTSDSSSMLLGYAKDLESVSNGKQNGTRLVSSSPGPSSPLPQCSRSPTSLGVGYLSDLEASQSTYTTPSESENSSCVLTPGVSFVSQQSAVISAKRWYHLRRNKLLWVLEFLVPCALVLLSLVLLTLYRPRIDQPPMDLHPWLMTARRKVPLISFIANENCAETLDTGSTSARELHNLVREDAFSWTGAHCLPRAVYTPRPKDDLICRTVPSLPRWTNSLPNESSISSCHVSNGSQNVPPVPHRVSPIFGVLLNLTNFDIPQYILHPDLTVSGELYGGISTGMTHSRLTVSNKALLDLMQSVRLWISHWLWDTSGRPRSSHVTRLFDLNFTTLVGILLPPVDRVMIWYNNKGYPAAPAYLNLLHNIQLRSRRNRSQANTTELGVVVANHPLPVPKHTWSFTFRETLKTDAVFALFLLLALCFIPANFSVLLVTERQLGIKHLHYVSGLRPHLYWVVNYAWDWITYSLMAMICVVFLALFQKLAFTSSITVGPFILIMLLHGCAIIPLIYLATFAFRQPSTAFVLVCAFNMLVATVSTSISFFLELLTLQEPSLQSLTNKVQMILRIFPHYCLGSSIYDLSVTRFLVDQGLLPEQTSASVWLLLYPRMLCLIAHTVCYLVILAVIEERFCWMYCPWPVRRKTAPLPCGDLELVNEEAKCLNPDKLLLDDSSAVIQIRHLSKRYRGQSRPAVDNLNMNVHAGECFGLLGTNGAGKSTTFAMLSGQLNVRPGTVTLNGYDLARQLSEAHQFMGFCPQSDALHDFMTARETLIMYGRLRQLSGPRLHSVVRHLLRCTGLESYANRLVGTFSGGTKRKLSTAIAFIGDPKVILLDEPSSGMDPSARKSLWRLVHSAVHRGCAVVLSSHCMEECETLCDRVGLLVDGQMRCDGGPLELKVRYSVGYLVDLELTSSAAELERDELESRLGLVLPGIRLRFPLTTRQQYSYSNRDRLSSLFEALNNLRREQLIKHFSVKHSTLEDAFVRCINQPETAS